MTNYVSPKTWTAGGCQTEFGTLLPRSRCGSFGAPKWLRRLMCVTVSVLISDLPLGSMAGILISTGGGGSRSLQNLCMRSL